jgi:membrane protein
MKKLKEIWKVTMRSFKGFSEDKIPKYSAALAYTTVFSFGPLTRSNYFSLQYFFWTGSYTGKNL